MKHNWREQSSRWLRITIWWWAENGQLTLSSTASESSWKRSAMGLILSGLKVPSVSMYATCAGSSSIFTEFWQLYHIKGPSRLTCAGGCWRKIYWVHGNRFQRGDSLPCQRHRRSPVPSVLSYNSNQMRNDSSSCFDCSKLLILQIDEVRLGIGSWGKGLTHKEYDISVSFPSCRISSTYWKTSTRYLSILKSNCI